MASPQESRAAPIAAPALDREATSPRSPRTEGPARNVELVLQWPRVGVSVAVACVVAFAAAGAARASGFLAAYLAALVLANAGLPHRAATRSFAEGLAQLAQIDDGGHVRRQQARHEQLGRVHRCVRFATLADQRVRVLLAQRVELALWVEHNVLAAAEGLLE